MKRLLLILVLLSTGCGGGALFVGTSLPDGAVTTTGLVSIVHLTVVSDGNGTLINVTVVTLVQAGTGQTFTFCGSQPNLFPIDQTVRVSFMPAQNCGNIIVVTQL